MIGRRRCNLLRCIAFSPSTLAVPLRRRRAGGGWAAAGQPPVAVLVAGRDHRRSGRRSWRDAGSDRNRGNRRLRAGRLLVQRCDVRYRARRLHARPLRRCWSSRLRIAIGDHFSASSSLRPLPGPRFLARLRHGLGRRKARCSSALRSARRSRFALFLSVRRSGRRPPRRRGANGPMALAPYIAAVSRRRISAWLFCTERGAAAQPADRRGRGGKRRARGYSMAPLHRAHSRR